MDPPQPENALPMPATSLSGRNPTADADASLIRKRPRLTPPQHGGNESASPTRSADSPLRLEVVTPDSHIDYPTDIILLDNEVPDFSSVDSFPWVTAERDPQQTAERFANICCDPDKTVEFQELDRFALWIQSHVVALPKTYDSRPYIQNCKFWYEIGRCFHGIATLR